LQDKIAHKEAAIEAGRKRQKYDFVGEISLSGGVERSRADNTDWEQTKNAGANFSQDLFRSGGIIASVRQAEFWAESEKLRLTQEINGYLRDLTTLVLQTRQDETRLTQNELSIKNAEIALFIKRRQYEAGEADITQLNDALKAKNNAQKSRLELLNAKRSRLEEIAKISPLTPEKIAVDDYPAIAPEQFAANSIAVKLAKVAAKSAKEQTRLTISSFLPTLRANAGASWRENALAENKGYNYGLSLSMPLSFTEKWAIEEKKLEALRADSEERAAVEESRRIYAQSLSASEALEKQIAVSEENIALYDSLIAVTRAQAESGDRSKFDLETLQNSRESDILDIEIAKLSLIIERAKLFYATN
jgi:outer membrane protein TolC